VLVSADGQVENRIVETPPGMRPRPAAASNYLNRQLSGLSLNELRKRVGADIGADRTALDALTNSVIEAALPPGRAKARRLADPARPERCSPMSTSWKNSPRSNPCSNA